MTTQQRGFRDAKLGIGLLRWNRAEIGNVPSKITEMQVKLAALREEGILRENEKNFKGIQKELDEPPDMEEIL